MKNTTSTNAFAAVLDQQRRVPAARVMEICGGISEMSLWRWLNDPALNFPKPIYIARRRYWREAEVLAWLEARQNIKTPEQLRAEAEALLAHADALEAEGTA